MAQALDIAAIAGSGTGSEPTGILNSSGISSLTGDTDGAAPEWSHVVELASLIEAANANQGRLAYLTNSKTTGKLRATPKIASTDSAMILEESTLLGHRVISSNNHPKILSRLVHIALELVPRPVFMLGGIYRTPKGRNPNLTPIHGHGRESEEKPVRNKRADRKRKIARKKEIPQSVRWGAYRLKLAAGDPKKHHDLLLKLLKASHDNRE